MNITLLVENNPKIESFYNLNLSTWLGLKTVTKSKGELALQYLETESNNVRLIIVRSRINKEQTAKVLIEFLKTKGFNIPVIIIGPSSITSVPMVHNSLDMKLLIKTAATTLNITAKEMSAKVVPDYFPIPISFVSELKRTVCPVFSQDINDLKKYKLTIEKQNDFDPKLITSLIQEGVDHLYVDKMDRLEFVSNVTSELMSTLKFEELSDDEVVSAIDTSVELISKKLLTIGITQETIELANKTMAGIRYTAKRNTKLSGLLDRLLNNKASYLYKHTQVLTYVSLHIIHNTDWGNADQEEKICFISFFHDIVLVNDEQCKISSMSELKRSTLTEEQKTLVEKHAQLSAEIVSKFPHAPMGSDQIIRQHHGQLNGLGFSDHYGANMSPMAMVFIVAEEFTRIIMKQEDGKMNRDQMIKELKEEFTTNRFFKIVEKLESITV